MTISVRSLGTQGLQVSAQGLGCMGMSAFYGTTDEKEALATIDRALELGVNLLDTADVYGPFTNEQLVGKAIRDRRDDVILATKFGIVRAPNDPSGRSIDGRPEYVKRAVDASLERLGLDHIDLYYQHRPDPTTPIEDTVGAMSELITEGKVRYIGLSEAGPETLRRGHSVHPITALQSEWSLWSRDIEVDVVDTARELGIGIVAYSPLGRGFLTGQITSPDDLEKDDWRLAMQPRFQGDNFARNVELVEQVKAMADEKGVTAGQLALAWVHAQGEDVFPIPGTKRVKWLEQNVAAFDVELTDEERRRLESTLAPVAGERYPDMSWVRVESRAK